MKDKNEKSKLPTKKWQKKKILVTGGRGFVGSHVVDILKKKGVSSAQIYIPDSKKDDLRKLRNALRVVENADIILHLASDVGGISYSSSHMATQLKNCLEIDLNIFEAISKNPQKKFVCLSSAVAYPELAKSPLREDDIFNGSPARGGYGYGIAKRTTIAMAKTYKQEFGVEATVLISTNAYGPRDSFDLEHGHVIPSLIRKCMTQEELLVWGDGKQIRDFIYVKDLAGAVVLAAESSYIQEPVNIGTGKGTSIRQLVKAVVKETHFSGKVTFDSSKPTGQKRRVLDVSKAKSILKFQTKYTLEAGIKETVSWYKENESNI